MTKEELKHEAEVYSYKLYHSKAWNPGEDMLVKAYLAGAEPREKQIQIDAEQIRALQKQNGELADNVKELEKEIKEWKDKADLWCKTANLKDHNIMINKELEQENAELKEELKKWKDEWQEQVQKATDEGYARTLQTIQLTNAKEIIKEFMKYEINEYDGSLEIHFEELKKQAEQFLSEVEK
jgi:cell division protein FtsB